MKIGIIGAGVMGLVLAYKLSKAGHQVEVLEAKEQIGGLTTWFDWGDFVYDKYYHVILKKDHHLLSLAQELGIFDQIRWKATKTGFLWKGEHLSLSNHLEFLTFKPLKLWEKFRLGAGILWTRSIKDPAPLEKIPALVWLEKIFGKKVTDTIWEPLVASKYGVLKTQVPATLLWSVINRYASTRSSKDGKEWMGHFHGGGMKVLLKALEKEVIKRGGKIFCQTFVNKIDLEHKTLSTNKGDFNYDMIVNTLPTALLKKIAPDFKEISNLPLPKFLGVIRLGLVLKESLSPYYVTNLIDKGLPFTGIIEVSHTTDSEEFKGKTLVMIPRYDVPESSWFEKSDEEIISTFIDHLKNIWPNLLQNIEKVFVHKEKIVQALWIDAPPREPKAITNREKTLWSINNELAGRDTLNNNAVVEVANSSAKALLESIR